MCNIQGRLEFHEGMTILYVKIKKRENACLDSNIAKYELVL